MKAAILAVCLVSISVLAQSPEASQYAPRPILLIAADASVEGVMPMVFTVNGQTHLEFITVSKIKESMEKGGMPVRLGDVLAALNGDAQTITQLQTENAQLKADNERLWKVAMKDAPMPQPQTVVIQQPQQDNRVERYMLLRSLMTPAQPYRVPMPVNPNANQIHCTTTNNFGTAYTNCN